MSTPHVFAQGDLAPIVNTVLFGEEEFHLANSTTNLVPAVVAPVPFKGMVPEIQQILAVANETVQYPVVAPMDTFAPNTVFHAAVTRTDPWNALTPAEIELNRETAYLSSTPVLANN